MAVLCLEFGRPRAKLIEVIVGSLVASFNPDFTKAQHPRKLHMTFGIGTESAVHVDLRHSERRSVDKSRLLSTGARNSQAVLSDEEKRALKQWLAARYGRPAFPTAFETRLRRLVGKRTVERQITKILEPFAESLFALFFNLGEERAAELDDGTPYFLSISVIHDATEGAQNRRQDAERSATELRSLFETAYGTADVATEITLDRCNAVADTVMTLADLRKIDQWRLEYMSLRGDPPGDFLAVGELPA